jgi:hypothetical protein
LALSKPVASLGGICFRLAEDSIQAKPSLLGLGRRQGSGGLTAGPDELRVSSADGCRLGPPLPRNSLLKQNRLSADGTFPRIVSEERIDFSLQEAFPHQAAHFASASSTLHVSNSLSADDEFWAAQLVVLPFPWATESNKPTGIEGLHWRKNALT